MPFPSLVRGGRRRSRADFGPSVIWPSSSARALPAGLRVADALTVGLAITACLIAWSGGFRERYGDIRLIITSWERIVLVALAVVVVRHAVRPTPSILARLRAGLMAGWRSRLLRTVLAAALVTRLTVLAVGYFASVTIAPAPNSVLFRNNTDVVSNLTARWDAGWYLKIIEHGYEWDGNRRHQQSVVFFPALPIAMYGMGLLVGKRWLLGGVVVGIVCFAWALTYLYRLAREQLGEEAAASAVWLLATYPFAVYFSVPYTEALYLLATVAAVYHTTRREPWAAAGWGVLAGLCRPNGFLLSVPLAILLVGPAFVRWLYKRAPRPEERAFRPVDVVAIVAPVVGLGLYSAYLWLRFDDPLAWQLGQLAWGRRYVGVWKGLEALFTQRWDTIDQLGFMGYTRFQPMDFLNTCAAVFVVATLVPLTLRLGPAYGALIVVNLFPPLIVGGMMSIGRMTSVMFPVFLWLATIVRPSRLPAWTASFAVFQGLIAALFFTWRPAF